MIAVPIRGTEGQFLRGLWRACLHWRGTVAACVATALAMAGIVIATSPDRFTGTAVLALDARKLQVMPQESVMSRLPQESSVLRTELDVIASRSMAEQVVGRIGLSAVLAKLSPGEPPWRPVLHELRDWMLLTGRAPAPAVSTADPLMRDAVDALLDGLRVSNDGRSYTIFITFTSADPGFAASVANAFADSYLNRQINLQTVATRGASEWLGAKLADQRERLERAESSVQAFRSEAGLNETNGSPLRDQRLSSINAELALARSARAGAEARLATATELAKSESGLEAFANVLDSRTVQALRQEQAQAARSLAELQDAGAVNSTQLPTLRSQLDTINRQIAAEVQRIIASLNNEVSVIRRKESDLQEAVTALETELAAAAPAAVRLRQMEREAKASRDIYEAFLTRYKQTLEQDGLTAPEARLISQAVPPERSSTPRFSLLGIALIGGFGSGLFLAHLREHMNRRLRSSKGVADVTGLPVLGVMPETFGPFDVRNLLKPRKLREARALRCLAASLRFSPAIEGAKVIVLTSLRPSDGKTTLCVALSRTLASKGVSVAVIDAGKSSPEALPPTTAHRPDRSRNGGGAVPPFAEKERQGIKSSASFVAHDPSDMAGLSRIVATLRPSFDMVLIDTPSLAHSPEAAMAARVADAVILLVRWRLSTEEDVLAGLAQLAGFGVRVAAIVLSRANPRQAGPPNWGMPDFSTLQLSEPRPPQRVERPPIILSPPNGQARPEPP